MTKEEAEKWMLDNDTSGGVLAWDRAKGDDMLMGRNETREEMIKRWEAEGWLVPSCPSCQKDFYSYPLHPSSVFAPSHKSLSSCESGKHPHCTCPICWG